MKAKDIENSLHFASTENTIKLLPKIINIVCLYLMPTVCMPSSIPMINYEVNVGGLINILPQIRL